MTHKLVIISIDALGASDIAHYKDELPTINALIESGTLIENVTAIYPSLTYPSHVTLMTGTYPIQHGIVNNTKIQSNRLSPDWYWYDKDIKCQTLYDKAKDAGLSTAAFLWPVTGTSSIDYNIAEIFSNRIWTHQVLVSLKASSSLFLFHMNQKYGHLRKGISQPYLDDFITACAVDTLQTKQPDLTLVHLVDMDSMRHSYGVQSNEAIAALKRQDARVSAIIEATKKAGTYDATNFVILGDHFQLDVDYMICLNTLFTKKGWASPKRNGSIEKNWSVYAKSCDGSAYIYCKKYSAVDPNDILSELSQVDGIDTIYRSDEVKKFGADGLATFMVEAKKGYYFSDDVRLHVIERVHSYDIGQPNCYRAVHGFHPNKPNYFTTAIFNGPDIKSGHKIPQARLIDEAPTFAKLLNLTPFPSTIDGSVLDDIFINN